MGPFPHSAPKSVISADNPAGTDGFEFVEFAHPEPEELRQIFARMGYELVGCHRSKRIELWQQGDITYILNAEPGSFAARFAAEHGPCAPAMGWRVADAAHAFRHAVAKGAEPYEGDDKTMNVPVKGIGEVADPLFHRPLLRSLNPYNEEFDCAEVHLKEWGFFLDHLTCKRPQGQHGQGGSTSTGGCSTSGKSVSSTSETDRGAIRALTSRKIIASINEDRGEKTNRRIPAPLPARARINIAVGTRGYLRRNRCDPRPRSAVHAEAADELRMSHKLLTTSDTYYELLDKRIPGHGEDLEALRQRNILVDGTPSELLLQIFSENQLGPIFFEFIQRKGNEGFGEGNFKALFESIEADQIARGVLHAS